MFLKAAAGKRKADTKVGAKIEVMLEELKRLFLDVKKDAENAWQKYKFLQIQIDMINDRLDRIEHAIGEEIEIDAEFDLDNDGWEDN